MKTMKKVISVLLLVCVLASFATVSAYAEEVTANTAAPVINSMWETSSRDLTKANGAYFNFKIGYSLPDECIGETYDVFWSSSDPTLVPISGKTEGTEKDVTCGTNTGITPVTVTVEAVMRERNSGKESNVKSIKLTFPATGTAPAPVPTATPTIKIKTPAETNVSMMVGSTIELVAEVSNGSFKNWVVEGPSGCGVFSSQTSNYSSFTAGSTAYNTPIKIYANANGGVESEPIYVTITAIPEIKFATDPANAENNGIANTNVLSVWVQGREKEEFDWTYTTSPSGANIITSPRAGKVTTGTGFSVTAGTGNGYVTITATAKDGTKKSASITVPVNTIGYGDAKLSPTNVTWSRGQGNLTFTIEPFLSSAYIDDVCITGGGNTSKYSYVWSSKNLIINSSYLATLSAGEHVLTVNAVYSDSSNAGTRYAYITISGTASAAYGDNAHVRGTSSNLYFNSNGAIKNVYISNQLIDPANYTLSNNGKSITLKAGFLNLLNYGSYTMKLENTNGGTETATFRIVTANYAPATGDESNLAIWVAVMLISGVGAVALIPRRKKEM